MQPQQRPGQPLGRRQHGTLLATVMLAVLQALGLRDLERFGDSDGAYNIEYGQPS